MPLLFICLTVLLLFSLLSPDWLFATPWTAVPQASLSFTISQSLLKLMSIELVMLSNHLILYCPLLLLSSVFPSIRVFSSELALRIRWQSIRISASASVLPMNIQGWFPFGLTGWNFLVVQGTLKSLFQHHSSKSSILRSSAFFTVQLSHPYWSLEKP